MNGGKIVEQGDCREVLRNPREEYTRRLIAAVPRIRGAVAGSGD
jgi:ABC-type glutathione transport system ATPase component